MLSLGRGEFCSKKVRRERKVGLEDVEGCEGTDQNAERAPPG
jgi:hypothetical protein